MLLSTATELRPCKARDDQRDRHEDRNGPKPHALTLYSPSPRLDAFRRLGKRRPSRGVAITASIWESVRASVASPWQGWASRSWRLSDMLASRELALRWPSREAARKSR